MMKITVEDNRGYVKIKGELPKYGDYYKTVRKEVHEIQFEYNFLQAMSDISWAMLEVLKKDNYEEQVGNQK